MTQSMGIVTAAVQLGLQSILVRPTRSIGPFTAQVTFEETHDDEMVITDHPVETGAPITDHSYQRPATVTIRCGWSNSPSSDGLLGSLGAAVTGTVAAVGEISKAFQTGMGTNQSRDIYQKLLTLQKSRIPFAVMTGKRAYTSMLVKSLRTETNKETENALIVTAILQEIFMVSVATIDTTTAPANSQSFPAQTPPALDRGMQTLGPATNSVKQKTALDYIYAGKP